MARSLLKFYIDLASALDAMAPGATSTDGEAALYRPSPRLTKELDSFVRDYKRRAQLTASEIQKLGYRLERIIVLAFGQLRGLTSIKSYPTPTAQHDLVVTGESQVWKVLARHLGLGQRGILVEAKARESKVADKEFARLCAILQLDFAKEVGLGVFVSAAGASGFPARKQPRQGALKAARLRQALFYAASRKPVIVFDLADLRALKQPGGLIRLLTRKIRDVEELSGKPVNVTAPVEVQLPGHLKGYWKPAKTP